MTEAPRTSLDPRRATARTSPRRIAFFVNRFPLVSETFVLNLAKGVLDRGWQLDVYAFSGPPDPSNPVHPQVEELGLMSRLRETRMPLGRIQRVLALPGAVRDALRLHGSGAIRTLPPFNFRYRARNLRLLFEAATIENGAYDVLHCQFATLAPKVIDHLDIGTLSGRLLVHIRGHDITRELRRMGPGAYRRAFAEADWFIANSDHFRRTAIAAGCPESRISVIPSGIDLDAFPFSPPLPPTDRPLRLLAVGRLVEKKGFRYALEAVGHLNRQGPVAELDLVGEGPRRHELERLAADLDIDGVVRFHGARTSDQVKGHLDAAHLFLAPSVTAASGDQDAATNTVKEAMAVGLPVVATHHGGMPELVEDGKTGFLVPERDGLALAERIREVIASPERWAPVARRARSAVAETADNDVVNARIADLYDRMIGEGLRPA